MSEGFYDLSGKAICKKCNTDMILSIDRNFKGPKCKNPKCDGDLSDAEYDMNVDIQKGPNLINFE